MIVTVLFSYQTISDSFHVANEAAKGAILPELTWSSPDTCLEISQTIKGLHGFLWDHFNELGVLSHNDTQGILNQLEDFDFRYMELAGDDSGDFFSFANWLFKCVRPTILLLRHCQPHNIMQGPLNTLMRTEITNELEKMLLYKAASEEERPMEPVVFPIDPEKHVSH